MTQQARPFFEQGLPQYELNRLDRERALRHKNAIENPAVMAAFSEMHRKIDLIYLKLLELDKR